jgi:ABC-type bacteriocin/lantibiotic exporter with double-glycine peptidase domain
MSTAPGHHFDDGYTEAESSTSSINNNFAAIRQETGTISATPVPSTTALGVTVVEDEQSVHIDKPHTRRSRVSFEGTDTPTASPERLLGDRKASGEKKDPNKRKGISRLLAQAGPEKWLILLSTIALLLNSLTNLAIPRYFGIVVDAIGKSQAKVDSAGNVIQQPLSADELKDQLKTAVLELVVIIAIGAAAGFTQNFLFSLSGERMVARIRKRLFRALVEQEVAMFDVTRTGELTNRLSSDTTVLKVWSILVHNFNISQVNLK